MTEQEEKEWNKLGTTLFAKSWQEIRDYLRDENTKGITEFRIAFQDNDHFIIHPLGKNGKTIDLRLSGMPVD